MGGEMDPVFFSDASELRAWLAENHASVDVAWVGLHKKATGRPSVTWPELVDELLCFGWIDGLRRSLDDESYAIRITPRRPDSNWSLRNLARARELIAAGRMEAPGRAAFDERDEERIREEARKRREAELGDEYESRFRANRTAWEYFQAQPPSYRKRAAIWVMTAKREETRRRRLETLIRDSENGLRIGPMRR